jgi:hypothetical protein
MHDFWSKSQAGSAERVCSFLALAARSHQLWLIYPVSFYRAFRSNRYLHTVESRLHEVEALLGILLSIPDNRAATVLADIAEDKYAKQIMDRVNRSQFGHLGRVASPITGQSASSSEAGNNNGNNGDGLF